MAEEAESVENSAPEATAEPKAESVPTGESVPAPVEPETPAEAPVEAPPFEQKQEETTPEPVAAPPEEVKEQPRTVTRSHTAVGERMRRVTRARKRERLEQIMDFAREKRVIRNRNVKILLQVSDATATRYLKELVQKGDLKQLGRGRGVRYVLP